MKKINIKPLSVNEARQGKRFKTNKYIQYEKILKMFLKPIEIPKWNLRIDYIFWFSNAKSDIDNPVKPFQDILCKRYWFNDDRIYEITIQKRIVKKGEDYICFEITPTKPV